MDFTHIDGEGKVRMVDVSGKPIVKRTAVAEAFIAMAPATVEKLRGGLIQKGDARGAFNLTAPNPATQAEVGKAIAKTLGRPYYLPAPEFAFNLAFGEVSALVTHGQRVMPERLLELGFEFQFPELGPALQDILIEA